MQQPGPVSRTRRYVRTGTRSKSHTHRRFKGKGWNQIQLLLISINSARLLPQAQCKPADCSFTQHVYGKFKGANIKPLKHQSLRKKKSSCAATNDIETLRNMLGIRRRTERVSEHVLCGGGGAARTLGSAVYTYTH